MVSRQQRRKVMGALARRPTRPQHAFAVRMWKRGAPLGSDRTETVLASSAIAAEVMAEFDYPGFDHYEAAEPEGGT